MTNREKILKEGKDEFIRKGYYNASIRAIAKQCGISHVAIHNNHFKTKEKLFNEIVNSLELTEENAKCFPVEFAMMLEKKIFEKGLTNLLLEQPDRLYEIMILLGVKDE